ncbi:MAG: copper amine oxidase N-terminal domain-containing protein [Desulfotomaculaceae bacterium]|nr:copper amine oxidase N-terminal domain-containing protein [Desulfotomaculaceae bacterium]MDD4767086.1 copper amine oxidase N-terminal domain-containing protein [Desulfotomaculaceae bacterium]
MRVKRKAISIMITLSMLLVLLVPLAAPAGAAASDNYAVTVPYVKADDGQTLGVLAIEEDDRDFRDGDIVTVDLPSGVEYAEKPNAATADEYFYGPAEFVTATNRSITVEVYGGGADILYFYYGEDEDGKALDSVVDIDSDKTGDIEVDIDAAGTTITSGTVRLARIVDGDTVTTIADVETIAIDATEEIETIKIKENTPGVLQPSGTNDPIELTLPKNFEWDLSAFDIDEDVATTAGLVVDEVNVKSGNKKVLQIWLGNATTSGQAGFITLSSLRVAVPDDAKEGDVEMNVDGNEVTEEDILIARVGDFGFEVDVDGDVPTIVAGKADQEVADFYIDDIVPGTWINGRSVKLTLPSWAEWTEDGFDKDIDELYNGRIDEDDPEIAKYTVDGKNGKAEFEEFTVTVDADAPEGDLVVKFSGSAGVDEELVIAKIVKPFTVTADTPEVFIGLQDQAVGDITITETQDEAIDEDKWIILRAPVGFDFNDDYDIEATELDIDNDEVDGRYLAFEVTGESSKEAGEIKISNITFNVDRTIPVGDITFEVFMTDNDAIDDYGTLDFDEAIDKDNYEEVTDVVVGNVMNPAPGGTVTETSFTIGSTTYVVNGVEKTADVAPYISGDRTFFAVRFVANALGVPDANISWNPVDQSVLIIKGERVLKLVIGSTTMMVNGVPVIMDVAPQIVEPGRTMLPVRWVAEALGASVAWDAATQTATLTIK